MLITGLNKVEKIRPNMEGAKGVFKQVLLSRNDGAPTFSFRVFTVEPGGHTPLHSHPFEHMNYVIEGQGTLVAGDRELAIEQGNFAMVLPSETHQFKNALANKPLVFICAVPKEYE
jgi:quercetin dioxygenase-like cupin family protein